MSSTTLMKNKATTLARVQALIAGTQKHFPSGSFTLGNATYTTASLVQVLQSLVDAFARVDAAHASAKDLVAEQRSAVQKAAPLMRDYTKYVRAMFGTGAVQLADFGLLPPKARTPPSAEKRAAAKAKLEATRKARGTTSKKQKLAVKGDVTGVVVTPVTHPAPAAAPPTAPVGPAPAAATPVVAPK